MTLTCHPSRPTACHCAHSETRQPPCPTSRHHTCRVPCLSSCHPAYHQACRMTRYVSCCIALDPVDGGDNMMLGNGAGQGGFCNEAEQKTRFYAPRRCQCRVRRQCASGWISGCTGRRTGMHGVGYGGGGGFKQHVFLRNTACLGDNMCTNC